MFRTRARGGWIRAGAARCYALLFVGLSLFQIASAVTLENWVATAVRFTQWPSAPSATRWTVCQPLGERSLQMESITVRTRAFNVVTVASPSETGPCDVFVITSIGATPIEEWVTVLRSRPVLTVGLGQYFCRAGAALCIARNAAGQNAFVVNTAAYTGAGMRMSGHLPVHPSHAAPDNLARAN